VARFRLQNPTDMANNSEISPFLSVSTDANDDFLLLNQADG
jgi:hypothetical protein